MQLDQQVWERLSFPRAGVGCSGETPVTLEPGQRVGAGGVEGRDWLCPSSLFLFSGFYLFGFALVYLFVHFLLTEASVNDIVVLNSTLGTPLCPCFGLSLLNPRSSLLGSRGFHCGGREP